MVKRRIKVAASGFSPTLQNERVPNFNEMSKIYNKSELRESVIISLIAKSGLRPGVIGNYNGTEGLRIRDLPDITICGGKAKSTSASNRIVVRRELSKAGHQYFTFSTQSTTEQILAYLNDRITCGETLTDDSPVVHPNDHRKTHAWRRSRKIFLPTQRVSDKIRQILRPEFAWRPYVLRAYFDTQLLIAESRGKIAHDFRVFFMGHKGTMESRYTTNKGILPVILVNEMSNAFARSEEYLDQSDPSPRMEQRQQILEIIDHATPQQINYILDTLAQCTKMSFGEPAVQCGTGQLQ